MRDVGPKVTQSDELVALRDVVAMHSPDRVGNYVEGSAVYGSDYNLYRANSVARKGSAVDYSIDPTTGNGGPLDHWILQECLNELDRGEVFVTRFGAVADQPLPSANASGTDNGTALQAAADYAGSLVNTTTFDNTPQPVLVFPFSAVGGFGTTQRLVVPDGVAVDQTRCPMIVTAADTVTSGGLGWLRLGGDTDLAANLGTFMAHSVIDVRRLFYTWTDLDDVGVVAKNQAHGNLHIELIMNFAHGIEVQSQYLDVTTNVIQNARLPMRISNDSMWSNATLNIGGSFANNPRTGNLPRYGIVVRAVASGVNNVNIFCPSFELSTESGQETIPILVDATDKACTDINFLFVRTEGSLTGPILRTIGDCTRVVVVPALGVPIAEDSTDEASAVRAITFSQLNPLPVFDSGRLIDRVYEYRSNRYSIAGMRAMVNAGANPTAPTWELGWNGQVITKNADGSVTIPGVYWGLIVDTTCAKQLMIAIGATGATKIGMVAFSDTARPPTATVSGATEAVRRSIPSNTAYNNGVYGGIWTSSNPVTPAVQTSWREHITVRADVKSLFIGVNGSNIHDIKIFSFDFPTSAYVPTDHGYDRDAMIVENGPPLWEIDPPIGREYFERVPDATSHKHVYIGPTPTTAASWLTV